MFIKKLILENFRQFKGRHVIHFTPGFNLIQGPNGTGKSNLLYAILYGIYGKTHKRLKASLDLISFHEEYFSVTIELENHGKSYRIFRRINKDETEDYTLEEWSDARGEYKKIMTAQTPKNQFNHKIEEITGIREMVFENIVFAEQKMYYQIVKGDKEFMDNALHVLPLNFIKNQVHALIPKKAESQQRAESYHEQEAYIEEAKQRVTTAEGLLETARDKEARLNAELSDLVEKNKAYAGIDQSIAGVSPKIEALVKSDNAINQAANEETRFDGEIATFVEANGDEEALDYQEQEAEGTKENLESEKRGFEVSLREIGKEVGRLGQAIASDKDTIDKMKGLEGLAECPICKQKVPPEHIAEEIDSYEADMQENEAKKDELEGQSSMITKEIASKEAEIRAQSDVLKRIRDAKTKLTALSEGKAFQQQAQEKANARYQQLFSDIEKPLGHVIETFNDTFGESLDVSGASSLADIQSAVARVKSSVAIKLGEFTATKAKIDDDLNEARGQIKVHEASINDAMDQIEAVKKRMRSLKVDAYVGSRIEQLDAIIDSLVTEFREKKIEQLTGFTLEWYRRLVAVPTFRDIKIDKEDYSVSVLPLPDIVPDGEWKDITKYASGGHETFVGIAERLALIEIFNTNFGMFDEVTDNADKVNATNVITELAKSEENLEQVIAVTHFEVGREVAGNIIRVEPINDEKGTYSGWSKLDEQQEA
jgi:DNA repair exonuclease SbcCD ATPase subunit